MAEQEHSGRMMSARPAAIPAAVTAAAHHSSPACMA